MERRQGGFPRSSPQISRVGPPGHPVAQAPGPLVPAASPGTLPPTTPVTRRFIEGIDRTDRRIKLAIRWCVEPSGTAAIGSEGGTPPPGVLAREFGLSETVARSLAAADAQRSFRANRPGNRKEKGPSGSESPHVGDAEPIRRNAFGCFDERIPKLRQQNEAPECRVWHPGASSVWYTDRGFSEARKREAAGGFSRGVTLPPALGVQDHIVVMGLPPYVTRPILVGSDRLWILR
jgi:hypothetical protein